MKSFFKLIFYLSAIVLSVTNVQHIDAALIASDNAGNYSGWPGQNQGSGFENWSFVNQGGGSSGEYLAQNNGGSAVNSGNGNAWGMYANGAANAEANAIRPFSEGNLLNGQTLSVRMNNGGIGGSIGFSLRDASHNNVFEFYFHGGDHNYTISVGGSAVGTSVGYTTDSLTLAFTQGSGSAWSFGITPNGGSTANYSSSGTSLNLPNNITEIRFFSFGNNNDIFFNDLQIEAVPEPVTVALGIFAGLSTLAGAASHFRKRLCLFQPLKQLS